MSLFESGESNGQIRLCSLFEGETDFVSESETTLEDVAYLVCRGGWPSDLTLDREQSPRTARDFLGSVVNTDISKVDGTRRNPDAAKALLTSISRRICTLADIETITADMDGLLTRKTVTGYMTALKKLFVTEDIPAWSPSLASRTKLRRSPKRNLTDPSIAAAALNADPDGLMSWTVPFGSLFESLCIRDLRIYSQPLEGRVYYYHDNSGLEVNAIIELDDGRWAALEIRLSSGIEKAAANLIRLRDKVILSNGIKPSFLAIITSTGFYHVRKDGILVIPIGCLRD